jgi:hypothetical protein
MAVCNVAREEADMRICGKAGSKYREPCIAPEAGLASLWTKRFELFPGFFDHMIETEDGYSFPSAYFPLIMMSGVLADMVEEQKRERNLVDLPVTVPIRGVRGDILEALVELFYTGEVTPASLPNSLELWIGCPACLEQWHITVW